MSACWGGKNKVLNVSNLVILRGMAIPENLAIHVFAGPTVLAAVQQLTAALYSYTYPPPRNYGLHVCPNETLTSVEEAFLKLNETVESLDSLLAPWDSHCLNERLASSLNRVFTSEELEHLDAAIELLEGGGRSFAPHLSPMVSRGIFDFSKGVCFIKLFYCYYYHHHPSRSSQTEAPYILTSSRRRSFFQTDRILTLGYTITRVSFTLSGMLLPLDPWQ